VITITTVESGKNSTITKTTTSTSHGDMAYLNMTLNALKDIRELWGVNLPI
jgi:hypothetical protein